MRVVLRAVAIIATGVGCVALVLHAFATPWQPTIVLTAFSHQLMWGAPVGLALAAGARRWSTALIAFGVTVAVLAVQLPVVGLGVLAPPGPRFTVMQANLKVGGADSSALTATVRSRRVDVLATDELTTAEEQRLVAAGLPALLPYRYTAPLPDGGGGLGIWSRYPLSEPRNLPRFELGVLTVRLAAPGGAVTFVAAHLLPPYPYPARIWRGEIARLRTVLSGLRTNRPVIVAGDFNATADHAQFRALVDHGYADAAGSVGAGYQPTYPTDRWFGPVIGIDHVLTRGAVRAIRARTLELRGSDHRALLVEIGRRP